MGIQGYKKLNELCLSFNVDLRVEGPEASSLMRLRLKGPGTGFTGDIQLLYENINNMLSTLSRQGLLSNINLRTKEGAFRELETGGRVGSQSLVATGMIMDKKPNVRWGEIDLIVDFEVLGNIENNLNLDI